MNSTSKSVLVILLPLLLLVACGDSSGGTGESSAELSAAYDGRTFELGEGVAHEMYDSGGDTSWIHVFFADSDLDCDVDPGDLKRGPHYLDIRFDKAEVGTYDGSFTLNWSTSETNSEAIAAFTSVTVTEASEETIAGSIDKLLPDEPGGEPTGKSYVRGSFAVTNCVTQ